MKTLQLYKDGKEVLASDGIMYVDGRLTLSNIVEKVKERNTQFAKNFPHKIADSFSIYLNRIGGNKTKVYKL